MSTVELHRWKTSLAKQQSRQPSRSVEAPPTTTRTGEDFQEQAAKISSCLAQTSFTTVAFCTVFKSTHLSKRGIRTKDLELSTPHRERQSLTREYSRRKSHFCFVLAFQALASSGGYCFDRPEFITIIFQSNASHESTLTIQQAKSHHRLSSTAVMSTRQWYKRCHCVV